MNKMVCVIIATCDKEQDGFRWPAGRPDPYPASVWEDGDAAYAACAKLNEALCGIRYAVRIAPLFPSLFPGREDEDEEPTL
jgi:hypothetical protein